jgi:hypothetical protein
VPLRHTLDLPSCSAASGKLGDVFAIDGQIGDKAIAVAQVAVSIAYLDHQPVDGDGVSIAAQRHIAEPLIPVDDPLFAAANPLGQSLKMFR